MAHALASGFGGGLAADSPVLVRRVGSDDEKIGAGAEVAVTGSGGKDSEVSGLHRDLVTVFASQH